MATNLIKPTRETPIVWADTTDYTGAVSGYARTHQLDLTSVASAAARQGAKADFGVTKAGMKYAVYVGIEIVGSAASQETIDFYHASSPSGTAGDANPGGTTGADADYTGTSGDSLDDSLDQLLPIGSLVTTADNTTTVQYGMVGIVNGDEIERYGMPVVVNNSTGALMTDAVEMYVVYVPITPDIQAAA